MHKYIFSNEYILFMKELLLQREYKEDNNYLEFPFLYDKITHP